MTTKGNAKAETTAIKAPAGLPDISRIRYAAHWLRAVSSRAGSGPWHTTSAFSGSSVTGPDGPVVPIVRHRDAEHIATVHPGVALALADWLDYCANDPQSPHIRHALTIAEQIPNPRRRSR